MFDLTPDFTAAPQLGLPSSGRRLSSSKAFPQSPPTLRQPARCLADGFLLERRFCLLHVPSQERLYQQHPQLHFKVPQMQPNTGHQAREPKSEKFTRGSYNIHEPWRWIGEGVVTAHSSVPPVLVFKMCRPAGTLCEVNGAASLTKSPCAPCVRTLAPETTPGMAHNRDYMDFLSVQLEASASFFQSWKTA